MVMHWSRHCGLSSALSRSKVVHICKCLRSLQNGDVDNSEHWLPMLTYNKVRSCSSQLVNKSLSVHFWVHCTCTCILTVYLMRQAVIRDSGLSAACELLQPDLEPHSQARQDLGMRLSVHQAWLACWLAISALPSLVPRPFFTMEGKGKWEKYLVNGLVFVPCGCKNCYISF